MRPQDQKRTSRLKIWLIYTALAIIAFFPTEMLAASTEGLIGSWSMSSMNSFGAFTTTSMTLNANKSGSYSITQNGSIIKNKAFVWSLDADTFCMHPTDGNRACFNVNYVTNTSLSLSSYMGTVIYTRTDNDVSFGAGYHKLKCSSPGCQCREYRKKSTFNSDCDYPNCGHAKGDHYEFR